MLPNLLQLHGLLIINCLRLFSQTRPSSVGFVLATSPLKFSLLLLLTTTTDMSAQNGKKNAAGMAKLRRDGDRKKRGHIKKDFSGMPVNFWSKISNVFVVQDHNVSHHAKTALSGASRDLVTRVAEDAAKLTRAAGKKTVDDRAIFLAARSLGWMGAMSAMPYVPPKTQDKDGVIRKRVFPFGQSSFHAACKAAGAKNVSVTAVWALTVVLKDALHALVGQLALKPSETVMPSHLRMARDDAGLDKLLQGDFAKGGVDQVIQPELLKPCKKTRSRPSTATRKTTGRAGKTGRKSVKKVLKNGPKKGGKRSSKRSSRRSSRK